MTMMSQLPLRSFLSVSGSVECCWSVQPPKVEAAIFTFFPFEIERSRRACGTPKL